MMTIHLTENYMWYACLELKQKTKDNVWIVKIPFVNRDDAREYISTHFDKEFHAKCWTE